MENLKDTFAGASVRKRKLFVRAAIVLGLIIVISVAMRIADHEEPMTHTPPLAAGQGGEQVPGQFAQNLTPADTVAALMRALREWNVPSAAQWMTTTQGSIFSDTYRDILAPVSERIEFNINVQRADGGRAIVEVAVYAVDLPKALGDMTEDAANYLLHRELADADPNWPEFVAEQLARLGDTNQLIRVMRTAAVHLVADPSGNWLLDAQNPDNTAFYNAASGGLLDLLEGLEQIRPASE